jgi:hypothetical protein
MMGTDMEIRRITDIPSAVRAEADATALIESVTDAGQAADLLERVQAAAGVVKKMKQHGTERASQWAVLVLRAERKLGELLGPAQHGGDRRSDQVSSGDLKRADIIVRDKARKVYAVPEAVFNTYVQGTRSPTRAGLLKAGQPVSEPAPSAGKEEDMPHDKRLREHIALDAKVRLLRDAGKTNKQIVASLGSTKALIWDAMNRLEGEERGAKKGKKVKPWNEKSLTQQLRELKEAAGKSEFEQYMDMIRDIEVIARLSGHLQEINPASWYAGDGDPDWLMWMTELADSLTTLGIWQKQSETALNSWLKSGDLTSKISKLRNATGRTPEETKAYHDKADQLERQRQLVLSGGGA